MYYWLLLPIFIMLVGFWLLRRGRHAYEETGLPPGDMIYSDTGAWQKVEKSLLNRQYGLVGKPDYLVQITEKGRAFTIPVEVKSAKRPPSPHAGHILQLGAYCLLVEEAYRRTPPYGLLHYADATLRIEFTAALRREVLAAAEAIRRDLQARNVKRSHHEQSRCRFCGYQHGCGDQRLNDSLPIGLDK
jgi:CRISPR-associated exonuclease Cas4